jgi:drug/metabolite transporter (DMT)-like permease
VKLYTQIVLLGILSLWNYGDLQLLGVQAYAAPLISIVLLVVAGLEQPGWSMALACMVIIGGSLLAGVGRNRQATGKSPRYNCASDTLLQKAAVYSCSE